MKITIYCDELYPYWGVTNISRGDKVYELTEEEFADYTEVMRRFDEWQDRLDKMATVKKKMP